MIALDSSVLIAYLEGRETIAAKAAGMVLGERQACAVEQRDQREAVFGAVHAKPSR